MNYVLEHPSEFERLERQAREDAYDPRHEFGDIQLASGARVLDAGCGSGLVSRYLAKRFPRASFVGCDYSADRVSLAQAHPERPDNLHFMTGDLTALALPEASFDLAVCRYVIEHLPSAAQRLALSGIRRTLKPGGKLRVVDFDGLVTNLYPQSPRVAEGLDHIRASGLVDLEVGRKLPSLLIEAGYRNVQWGIRTFAIQGEALRAESAIMAERFAQCATALLPRFGNLEKYQAFCREYLASLERPECALFYNKFTVEGLA